MDTPLKINVEPENYGLEDDYPFSRGVFSGSMLIFQGVSMGYHSFQLGIVESPYECFFHLLEG